jgi:hypothetical protein
MTCEYCGGWTSRPLIKLDNIISEIKNRYSLNGIEEVCHKCHDKFLKAQDGFLNKPKLDPIKERKYTKRKKVA